MVVRIDPHSAADLRRVAAQLRAVGGAGAVRRETVKALRAAAVPTRDAVRAAALTLPDGPPKASTGWRKRAAAATGVQVRLSGRDPAVDVRISRKVMGDQAGLVRASNSVRWRHPVFGNRNVWASQTSRPRWFDSAVSRNQEQVRREMTAVLQRVAKRLEHR